MAVIATDILWEAGVIATVGAAALLEFKSRAGKGTGRSRASLFRGVEFFLGTTVFGLLQRGFELSGFTLSTTFGLGPSGSTLLKAGVFVFGVGTLWILWGVASTFLPHQGGTLTTSMRGTLRDLVLIGMLGIDAVFVNALIDDVLRGVWMSALFFRESVLVTILSVCAWPLVFFKRVQSRKRGAMLWVLIFLPAVIVVVVRLYQLGFI